LSFYSSLHHPHLHSFPTRRSSDLRVTALQLTGLLTLLCGPSAQGPVRGEEDSYPEVTIVAVEAGVRDPEPAAPASEEPERLGVQDRKSTRLNSSHRTISYAVFCLK